MDSKKNMVLLGLIVVLIGLLSILINFTSISIIDLMLIAGGSALLLLYRTKRKSWSLIFGGYLAYFGFSQVLNNLTNGFFSEYLFIAMFFIVPALIFFTLYFDKNKKGLLIPASLLFWLGLYLMLRDIRFLFFPGLNFFLYMGAAFFTIFMFAKNYMGKWPLYASVTLTGIGVLNIFKNLTLGIFSPGFRIMGSVIITIIGVIIIIRAVIKNRGRQ